LPAKNLTGHAGELEKLKEFRSAPEIVNGLQENQQQLDDYNPGPAIA